MFAEGSFAYVQCLTNGKWGGPKSAGGAIDPSFFAMMASRVSGSASPQYLKFTTNCSERGAEVLAAGSPELATTQAFARQGFKLGVAINAAYGDKGQSQCIASPHGHRDRSNKCVRTVADVIDQARSIKTDSDRVGGVYDWMFLDFAWDRTPAGKEGLDDLQQIVDGISKVGWDRIMINGTGFGQQKSAELPQRTWGVARHFTAFDGDDWRTTVQSTRSGLTTDDDAFIDFMKRDRPGSRIVLKLEHPGETAKFAGLSRTEQMSVLRQWADASRTGGWQPLYPFINPPTGSKDGPTGAYDSITAGTFAAERQLLGQAR